MIKQVKTLDDVQRFVTDVYNWITLRSTKDWDFRELRIKNASDGVDPQDYVTLRQLPDKVKAPPDSNIYRTIVFSKDGAVVDGESSPPDVIGQGIEGYPVEIWVKCDAGFEPVGTDLVVNIAWTRFAEDGTPTTTNLLTDNLHLPAGQQKPVFSSAFASPVPKLGRGSSVNKVIVTASGASFVSIGLVVKVGSNLR